MRISHSVTSIEQIFLGEGAHKTDKKESQDKEVRW